MPPTEISTGAIVPITVTLLDDDGPATGETLTYQVSRIVGGAVEILDRADMTFRAALSVATPTAALPEVDDETSPGLYSASLVTASITNPSATGIYIVTVFDGPFATDILDSWDLRLGPLDATTAIGVDVDALAAAVAAVPAAVWTATISSNTTITQAGGMVHLLRAFAINRLEEDDGNPGSLILYKDDNVTPWCTFTLRDQNGNAVVGATGEVARRSAAVVT